MTEAEMIKKLRRALKRLLDARQATVDDHFKAAHNAREVLEATKPVKEKESGNASNTDDLDDRSSDVGKSSS
jgi:hypothetical protein